MFDTLAAPDGTPLPGRAPVEIVTFQLDFEEERPLRPKDGLAWQRLLTGRGLKLPRLSQVRQQVMSLDVTTSQASLGTQRVGWQAFFDDDSSNTCLFSSAVNLERQGYPGFDRFRDECMHVFDAAEELVGPKVQTRLTLRYANALSDPDATSFGFWRGKVRDHFLGPIIDDHLLPNYERAVAVFHFVSGSHSADLRIGTQPDRVYQGSQAIVFVTEVYEQGVKEIHRNELVETLESLHTTALKLFYSLLTDDYAKKLRAGE